MFGQGRQYLVDEKVGDRAGCVRELVQCIADVTAAGQKRGGQANDGAPPLGEVLDDCEFVVAQRDVVLAEYRGDLGAIESEIGGCKAGESAVESQTMPRERWFVAGGNDNRQVARGLCEYPIEETDRHRIVEGVNVVEDQRCSALVRFEGFRKVREPLLDGRPGSGLHGEPLAGRIDGGRDRLGEGFTQYRHVVVALGQRQPGQRNIRGGSRIFASPIGQK